MEDQRAETGVMQFPDDYCGVFIRGDHAFMYKMAIDHAIKQMDALMDPGSGQHGTDVIQIMILRGLGELLASCDARSNPSSQKVRFLEDIPT